VEYLSKVARKMKSVTAILKSLLLSALIYD